MQYTVVRRLGNNWFLVRRVSQLTDGWRGLHTAHCYVRPLRWPKKFRGLKRTMGMRALWDVANHNHETFTASV